MARVLGVDLGTKRVGIAMTDASGTLASPHKVLPRTKQLHREIAAIVDEWEVEAVVVGLPLNMDGSSGPAAQSALADVKVLRDTLSVPVETYDERLTTVSADRYLGEAGMNAKKRRTVIDMVAAAIILEGWLDKQDKQNQAQEEQAQEEQTKQDQAHEERAHQEQAQQEQAQEDQDLADEHPVQ